MDSGSNFRQNKIQQRYRTQMLKVLLTAVLAVAAMAGAPQEETDYTCVAPGNCSPPDRKDYPYKVKLGVMPRNQWTTDGGFCGASSIQTLVMSFGAYIS